MFFYLGVNELGKYLVAVAAVVAVVVDAVVVVVAAVVVVCSVIISSLLGFFLIVRVDGMLKIRSKKVKRIFFKSVSNLSRIFLGWKLLSGQQL